MQNPCQDSGLRAKGRNGETVKGRKGEQERRRKGEKERCWKEAALEGMHFVHGRERCWKGEILRRVAPQNDRENGR